MADATPESNPLRLLRESYGLNRNEFCKATGIAYAYFANMETGGKRATPTALARLSEFGVDVSDLVRRNDEWLAAVRENAAGALKARLGGGGGCEPVPDAD